MKHITVLSEKIHRHPLNLFVGVFQRLAFVVDFLRGKNKARISYYKSSQFIRIREESDNKE